MASGRFAPHLCSDHAQQRLLAVRRPAGTRAKAEACFFQMSAACVLRQGCELVACMLTAPAPSPLLLHFGSMRALRPHLVSCSLGSALSLQAGGRGHEGMQRCVGRQQEEAVFAEC